MRNITLIQGDGIGPEITESVKAVVEAAGININWEIKEVGQKAILSATLHGYRRKDRSKDINSFPL
jgi:isocitrate/isopropylmalate dehydrogenase